MRQVVLVLCLAVAVGCDENLTGPTQPLGAEFVLAPGEAMAIEGASLSVRFNRVTGDNRCPADAVCVLGGSADINITVTSGPSSRELVLRTGDMQPVRHDGFTIALVQVQPYPFSARSIAPDEYRVTLRVSR